MSARDGQRSRVYDAEALVRRIFDSAAEHGLRTVDTHGSQLTLPIERRFASVESVQDYADRVLALNWVRSQWERATAPVRVRARAGRQAAHYEYDTATIAVPARGLESTWALRELVVLHELAHHLDPGSDRLAAHGPEYCARYLDLIDGVIGPEAAFLLRVTYLDCGVRLG